MAELRARADAGDRNAAGRLGELLAKYGDEEDALRVWARAYGRESSTTLRLAELMVEWGDVTAAVRAWQFSDPVWQNPEGFHAEYLDSLPPDERADEDDPEDWAFMEREELAQLLAERGDEASMTELRARAVAGDYPARKRLAEMNNQASDGIGRPLS